MASDSSAIYAMREAEGGCELSLREGVSGWSIDPNVASVFAWSRNVPRLVPWAHWGEWRAVERQLFSRDPVQRWHGVHRLQGHRREQGHRRREAQSRQHIAMEKVPDLGIEENIG